jgi:hypothetical protein
MKLPAFRAAQSKNGIYCSSRHVPVSTIACQNEVLTPAPAAKQRGNVKKIAQQTPLSEFGLLMTKPA